MDILCLITLRCYGWIQSELNHGVLVLVEWVVQWKFEAAVLALDLVS